MKKFWKPIRYEQLTITQAASVTGLPLSEIRRAIDSGELPAHPILVQMLHIKADDLRVWFNNLPEDQRELKGGAQ